MWQEPEFSSSSEVSESSRFIYFFSISVTCLQILEPPQIFSVLKNNQSAVLLRFPDSACLWTAKTCSYKLYHLEGTRRLKLNTVWLHRAGHNNNVTHTSHPISGTHRPAVVHSTAWDPECQHVMKVSTSCLYCCGQGRAGSWVRVCLQPRDTPCYTDTNTCNSLQLSTQHLFSACNVKTCVRWILFRSLRQLSK